MEIFNDALRQFRGYLREKLTSGDAGTASFLRDEIKREQELTSDDATTASPPHR